MMNKGLLIALEGIDGSGHSTRADWLREQLEKNISLSDEDEPIAIVNKEPTDGPIGGEIREYLSGRLDVDSETLALMFAADRRDHVENELSELLEAGKIVILDRYILSSLAYQGVEVDDDEWLLDINSKSPMPDLTILLDVSTSTALNRIERDRLKTEIFETKENLDRVKKKYVEIAETLKERGEEVYIINGNQSRAQVNAEISRCVYDLIQGKNRPFKFKSIDKSLSEF